jgi:hypothetical protein
LTENGLGYILGGIFRNSSGHPACEANDDKSEFRIMVFGRETDCPDRQPFHASIDQRPPYYSQDKTRAARFFFTQYTKTSENIPNCN